VKERQRQGICRKGPIQPPVERLQANSAAGPAISARLPCCREGGPLKTIAGRMHCACVAQRPPSQPAPPRRPTHPRFHVSFPTPRRDQSRGHVSICRQTKWHRRASRLHSTVLQSLTNAIDAKLDIIAIRLASIVGLEPTRHALAPRLSNGNDGQSLGRLAVERTRSAVTPRRTCRHRRTIALAATGSYSLK